MNRVPLWGWALAVGAFVGGIWYIKKHQGQAALGSSSNAAKTPAFSQAQEVQDFQIFSSLTQAQQASDLSFVGQMLSLFAGGSSSSSTTGSSGGGGGGGSGSTPPATTPSPPPFTTTPPSTTPPSTLPGAPSTSSTLPSSNALGTQTAAASPYEVGQFTQGTSPYTEFNFPSSYTAQQVATALYGSSPAGLSEVQSLGYTPGGPIDVPVYPGEPNA